MSGIITYRSYNFTQKDPVIDKLRTILQNEAKARNMSESQIIKMVHEDSGISVTTPRNWFYKDTKRPQNASIMAFALSLGYDRVFVKLKGDNPYAKAKRRG